MALTTLIMTFTVCLGHARLSLTPTARLLLLGIAVLALPLLYTRPEWREDALWRCTGLLGGWLFYVACLQLRLTPRQRELLLYGLLFAIGVQALLAALQLFAPTLAQVAPMAAAFTASSSNRTCWAALSPPVWPRRCGCCLPLSLRQRGGGNSVARAAGCFLRLAGADPVACRTVGRCHGGSAAAVAFCPPAPGREPLGRRRAAAGYRPWPDGTVHRLWHGWRSGLIAREGSIIHV